MLIFRSQAAAAYAQVAAAYMYIYRTQNLLYSLYVGGGGQGVPLIVYYTTISDLFYNLQYKGKIRLIYTKGLKHSLQIYMTLARKNAIY